MLAGGAELELGCQEEGRGRRCHPRPTILHLSWLLQGRSDTPATGLLKPERSQGVGAATGSRGATGGPTPVPHISQRPEPSLLVSRLTGRLIRGVPSRPGGVMLYACRLCDRSTIAQDSDEGPQPLAAGRTLAGSGIWLRGGHGPQGGPPRR